MGTHPIFESDFDCLTEMATKGNLAYCASKLSGGNMVPGNHLERFKPYRHRVLNLYKQSLRQMDRMCNVPYHQMALEMTLLRARFEENKHIKSLAKATELLKDGEEEYWVYQGTDAIKDLSMRMSEGGIAYERYSQYQQEVKITAQWGAEEWARYPDIYDNYKKWSAL